MDAPRTPRLLAIPMASIILVMISVVIATQAPGSARHPDSVSIAHLRTAAATRPFLVSATGRLEVRGPRARNGRTTGVGLRKIRGRLHAVRRASAPASPAPAARVATPHGATGANWSAIAACESGGRWSLNSGNGFWGGLQFLPSTWFAFGGGPFDGRGPFPYSAAAQIRVAMRVLAAEGPGAWPVCFR